MYANDRMIPTVFDFLYISILPMKNGTLEVKPRLAVRNPSRHLMIRGGDFYAVWVEEKGLWSTREQDVIDIIDRELDKVVKDNHEKLSGGYVVRYMWDAETGMIDRWHKFCKQQMRDSFHMLDEKIIFANTPTTIDDYASRKLSYPLTKGECKAWDRILSVLYSPEERKKIEWAIGAIVSGESRTLQKFLVLYGAKGTGKSTVIDIIEDLFQDYVGYFSAQDLGNANSSFALEAFHTNPLVAVQHDGNLSKLEDNTRLNSLVSHENMIVNEKFKSTFYNKFKCFLIMGTNNPVRITDAKSGLIRRLIDVSPTGNLIPPKEYKQLTKQVRFELGAIANHCLEVFQADPDAYDNYIPVNMLGATNDFYNFVMDSWSIFKRDDETTLKAAWSLYKVYCEEARVSYPYPQRAFKEELKNYFKTYTERETLQDGTRVRNHYAGFLTEKFEEDKNDEPKPEEPTTWLNFQDAIGPDWSHFDMDCEDCPAQYAGEVGPKMKWADCKTKLSDIDPRKLHYVQVPKRMVVIDFDIPDENGNKCLQKNIEAASKWPRTYAELSKSGQGIHLHYWYDGDISQLSSVYDDHIEVKVPIGNSSLRRMLTKCTSDLIATISSGLLLKEVKKTIDVKSVQSEKKLRELIECNLHKEYRPGVASPGTKCSIDFIFKLLDDAYKSDLSYDVSDMKNAVVNFARKSTNNADYCLKTVLRMHFRSEDKIESAVQADEGNINIFYDTEVFPSHFILCAKKAEDYSPKDFPSWKDYILKLQTDHKSFIVLLNPTPAQMEAFLNKYSSELIDFNGKRYDRDMMHARMMGYSTRQLAELSRRKIHFNDWNASFYESRNYGKTDIYDFASAGNKKSLKKLEIEMGIRHKENELPWDKDIPEDKVLEVIEYCKNDVLATEAAFNYLQSDWMARQILADLAGMTVNDSTNNLTVQFIFERMRNPQSEFEYRNLAEPVHELKEAVLNFLKDADPEMMAQTHGDEESLLPYFPHYTYENGVSTYRDEVVGEGGYVYSEPGMYGNVALLDVASMHPHSIIAECLFGPRFTKRFKEIVDGRVSIKHKAWDEVNTILDGKLSPYIQKVKDGEISAKDLANALKTAINSVYGLTAAAFDNAFRDPRNKDNIVAKRGALFMVDLKHQVQERGYTVAHIKTDSIKIPDADNDIIQFVMEFGKKYGYTFEHEATYDKMCLVNDSVYIARYDTAENCQRKYGYIPGDNKDHPGQWTATGKQFQVPYVFKKLFSKESITFDDMCEVFSVTGALYLDMNEGLPNVEADEKALAKYLKEVGLSYEDYLDVVNNPDKDVDDPAALEVQAVLLNFKNDISKGHNYHFVGRVGQFTPIKPGFGGGKLMRESGGKYAAATGTTGYLWMESEVVLSNELMHAVDRSFYDHLADEAVAAISKYGDFEWFVSEDMYDVPPEGDMHDN